MTLGAWRQWGSPPTARDMTEGICDERRPMWLTLTRWLRTTYDLDGDITWTDEDSGWVLRYRRNGRPLITLLPECGRRLLRAGRGGPVGPRRGPGRPDLRDHP